MSKRRDLTKKDTNVSAISVHRSRSRPPIVHRPDQANRIILTVRPTARKRLLPAIKHLIAKLQPPMRTSKQPVKAGEGRWPLDLVREASGSGMLALRVREGAGLEKYGLIGGDIVMIGLEDPSEGEPTFAAINDQIAIGWYKSRPGGRVRILPFVDGTQPVTAGPGDAQVLFKLQAIVSQRRLINHRQARRPQRSTALVHRTGP